MKPLFSKSAFVVAFCALAITAWATPPTLMPDGSFPNSVLPGHTYIFPLTYKQTEGDPPAPKSLKMVLDTPGGQVSVPAVVPEGNPTEGMKVEWTYAPENSGQYQYHFEATSTTGAVARYPTGNASDLVFESVNLTSKYIIMLVGLVAALLILPYLVYTVSRSANKRGDASAAARIAIFVGVLAAYALYFYLFADVYHGLGLMIAAVAALAILITLFSRRRTA